MTQSKSVRTWAAALLVAGATVACSSQDTPPKPPPPQARASVSSENTQKPAPAAEPAAATPAVAAPAADGPVAGVLEKTETETATVTAIDLPARRVTLREESGKEFTIVCGEEVRNLPQVKVGDVVTCEYHESVAYEVKKPGEVAAAPTATAVAARAKEGAMPAAAAGVSKTITATIVAIDREMKRVSLQGPDGKVAVVQVRDAEKLSRVSVGELVELTYTQAVAVSVSTPQAK